MISNPLAKLLNPRKHQHKASETATIINSTTIISTDFANQQQPLITNNRVYTLHASTYQEETDTHTHTYTRGSV
jgi:hypothetical protein